MRRSPRTPRARRECWREWDRGHGHDRTPRQRGRRCAPRCHVATGVPPAPHGMRRATGGRRARCADGLRWRRRCGRCRCRGRCCSRRDRCIGGDGSSSRHGRLPRRFDLRRLGLFRFAARHKWRGRVFWCLLLGARRSVGALFPVGAQLPLGAHGLIGAPRVLVSVITRVVSLMVTWVIAWVVFLMVTGVRSVPGRGCDHATGTRRANRAAIGSVARDSFGLLVRRPGAPWSRLGRATGFGPAVGLRKRRDYCFGSTRLRSARLRSTSLIWRGRTRQWPHVVWSGRGSWDKRQGKRTNEDDRHRSTLASAEG
jgi:hypothetical protein